MDDAPVLAPVSAIMPSQEELSSYDNNIRQQQFRQAIRDRAFQQFKQEQGRAVRGFVVNIAVTGGTLAVAPEIMLIKAVGLLRRAEQAGEIGKAVLGAGDAALGLGGLDDLARFRGQLGLAEGEGTLARLDLGGRSFYGINAHGQQVSLRVNAITRTHAEADAFQQAMNSGITGGRATLYVDRALCSACGANGGVRGLARQLGLQELRVVTPQGTQVIRP